jgi:hypothetical protein
MTKIMAFIPHSNTCPFLYLNILLKQVSYTVPHCLIRCETESLAGLGAETTDFQIPGWFVDFIPSRVPVFGP